MNYYYHPDPESNSFLSNEESSHAIKVLRKQKGDDIHIMDGKGNSYSVEITDANFRKCGFRILEKRQHPKKSFRIHIAIAPTKSIDRIEWFVEKACELGADEISLILTKRTERSKVKVERLEKKAISALKQSKNFWKCTINEPVPFSNFLKGKPSAEQKYIAFVETGQEDSLFKKAVEAQSTIILIGPEGDFTQEEVEQSREQGFVAVNLGESILRTETAGIVAAHTLNLINE